jgi:hypothetical protein
MLVGLPFSGKTSCIRVLQRALTDMSSWGNNAERAVQVGSLFHFLKSIFKPFLISIVLSSIHEEGHLNENYTDLGCPWFSLTKLSSYRHNLNK